MGGSPMAHQPTSASYCCHAPGCNLNGVEIDAAKALKSDWRCYLCEQPLHPVELAIISDLSPLDLPTYLALPWQSYIRETQPRLRLHWLVDTAEVAVRWCVAIAFAETLAASGGSLAEKLAEEIRKIILRPTLGAWLAILNILSAKDNRPATPLIAPAIFDLYQKELNPRFRSEEQGGTCTNSLLELRNHLVHGGGLSTRAATELWEHHRTTIESLLQAILAATPGVEVISLAQGAATLLKGPVPTKLPDVPAALAGKDDGPWLVSDDTALPLFPLLDYAPVRTMGDDGQVTPTGKSDIPQVYYRASLEKERLSYTPLGSDALCAEQFDLSAFYRLFGFDATPAKKKPGSGSQQNHYQWDDFLKEARNNERPLVGREWDLARIRKWLKGRGTRREEYIPIAWLHGAPGIGKSHLMAKLALDAANETNRQRVFYQCFCGGDGRNNRSSFLNLLRECLLKWEQLQAITPPRTDLEDDKALVADVTGRLKAITELPDLNANNPKAPESYPRLVVFLDGLDELASHDRHFPYLVKQLALPGTVWIVAGRNEHGLGQMFEGPDCEPLFKDDGLNKLTPEAIRSLLLDTALPNVRRELLKMDDDEGEGTNNDFIKKVVANADGLPLYVHLVIDDLEAGRIKADRWQELPERLTDYYNRLLERLGISTPQEDLNKIICILASAEEPLDVESLAKLLTPDALWFDAYLQRIEKSLRLGASLVRKSDTPDGTTGYMLYHQKFREHVAGKVDADGQEEIKPAEKTAPTLKESRWRLYKKACDWAALPDGNLRNHLFRCGNQYALWWGGDEGLAQAHQRLTDFDYLMARTKALPASNITELVKEYGQVCRQLPEGEHKQTFRYWEAFFRERAHILRRGNDIWPTYKILLQLAIEHADDSPVTIASERFLEEGKCNWAWLRRELRPEKVWIDPCVAVFEGHNCPVVGSLVLRNGLILSWAMDESIFIWNLYGNSIFKLEKNKPHTEYNGYSKLARTIELSDGNILTWHQSNYLRIWKPKTNQLIFLTGHSSLVSGAIQLSNKQILSWSYDKSLRLWDLDGTYIITLIGHSSSVYGAIELNNGQILSWSDDGCICLWSHRGKLIDTLSNRLSVGMYSAYELSDKRLVTLSSDHIIRILDIENKKELKLIGHTDWIVKVLELTDGRLLSFSEDKSLRIWGRDGKVLCVLQGHTGDINGAKLLKDGNILSWSNDATLRLWDLEGKLISIFEGHTCAVGGAHELTDGEILSWSSDKTLRLWSKGGCQLAVFDDHTCFIGGALELEGGLILSWSADNTLRIWDKSKFSTNKIDRNVKPVHAIRELRDGQIITLFSDSPAIIWDKEGQSPGAFGEYSGPILDTALLSNENFISWSWNKTLIIWDQKLKQQAILKGHENSVYGAITLSDKRILSWSMDCTLRLWGEGGKRLGVFKGHKDCVYGAFELSKKRILSWSKDRTLRIWDWKGNTLKILRGHSNSVHWAKELSSGKIISWSSFGMLRLWDWKGIPISFIKGFPIRVIGAEELQDGQLLMWSKEYECVLVDIKSGSYKSIHLKDVSNLYPHIYRLLLTKSCHISDIALGSERNTAFVNFIGKPAHDFVLNWHGISHCTSRLLTPDGRAIITQDNGQVCFLRVYRGDQRITISELEQIISQQGAA
jgi:WD40 repeat protein